MQEVAATAIIYHRGIITGRGLNLNFTYESGGVMETLIHDLRFGLRMLGRNHLFTAAAILMLAVGSGGIFRRGGRRKLIR